MTNVTKIPDVIWYCNCGCTSFFIHKSGAIECCSCQHICVDEQTAKWVERLPDIETQGTDANALKVTAIGSASLAKARVLKYINQSTSLIGVFGYEKNGAGKHWVDIGPQENKDTIIERVEALLQTLRDAKADD